MKFNSEKVIRFMTAIATILTGISDILRQYNRVMQQGKINDCTNGTPQEQKKEKS